MHPFSWTSAFVHRDMLFLCVKCFSSCYEAHHFHMHHNWYHDKLHNCYFWRNVSEAIWVSEYSYALTIWKHLAWNLKHMAEKYSSQHLLKAKWLSTSIDIDKKQKMRGEIIQKNNPVLWCKVLIKASFKQSVLTLHLVDMRIARFFLYSNCIWKVKTSAWLSVLKCVYFSWCWHCDRVSHSKRDFEPMLHPPAFLNRFSSCRQGIGVQEEMSHHVRQ